MMGGNGVKKKCATWVVTTILQQKAKATRDQREKERRKKKKERGASLLLLLLLLLFAAFDSRRRSSDLGCVCVVRCGSGIRDMPPQPTKAPLSPRKVNYSAIDAQARGESNAPRCVSTPKAEILKISEQLHHTSLYSQSFKS